MKSYKDLSKSTLTSTLASSSIEISEFNECLRYAALDDRMDFLQALPYSTYFALALTHTIETYFFNTFSKSTLEIMTLVHMFVVLLDGLLDETPEIISRELRFILDLLSKDKWLDPGYSHKILFYQKHPILRLLLKISSASMTKIKQSKSWVSDPLFRTQLLKAVEAALDTEYHSTEHQSMHRPLLDITKCKEILIAKSVNVIWVASLIPFSNHGWPPNLDINKFNLCMRSLGEYFGWIDDTFDIYLDIKANRWNNVLLFLYEEMDQPEFKSISQLKSILSKGFSNGLLINKLVRNSARLYDNVFASLRELNMNSAALNNLVADITLSYYE